ncbi:hypothetical protein [Variovorax sp. UMC13]|uniref:hypothetical protein n=1 Tax=Variovorax sp. UMC13 TaxID=1862326 RepID=UPI00160243C7|nr:hypothetical protein [Variovorax sp. UMC13]
MPQNNPRLTFEQKSAALAWNAACEKLHHFLKATPGYPALNSEEVTHMLDATESALHALRCTLEERGDKHDLNAQARISE